MGLQEVMSNDPSRDIVRLLSGLGYHHVVAPALTLADGRVMCNAVFSKYPIVQSEVHALSADPYRNAVQADIRVGAGNSDLHVFSTHLLHTHQKPSDIQISQVEKLISVVPASRALVMGDFNATADSTVIRKMRSALVDSHTEHIPTLDATHFDCLSCDASVIPDTRLDYIFATGDISTHDFHVHSPSGSDHLALTANVET